MSMTMLLFFSQVFNSGFNACRRGTKVLQNAYRLAVEESVWYINRDGVFVNSVQIASIGEDYWVYDENGVSKVGLESAVLKAGPFLSCVFSVGDDTVSMDDFLEETKFVAGTPFPVLMAAFTIYQKKLYNWAQADFTAYLRNGDEVKFKGNSPTF